MGLLGFNLYPLENISIADLWLAYVIIRFNFPKTSFSSRDIKVVLIFMLMFPLFGSIASLHSHFEWSNWATNSIRSVFYGVALLATKHFVTTKPAWVLNILKNNVNIVFVFVIIEVLFAIIGQPFSFYVPGLSQNIGSEINQADLRPSSFFDEPSYLAIFVAAHYYLIRHIDVKVSHYRLVCIIIMMLSGSVSGLLFVVIIMFFDSAVYRNASTKIILGFSALSILMWAISFFYFSRLESITFGQDASSIHRILGSLELIEILITDYWYSGVGLGQFLNWLSSGAGGDLINFYFHSELSTRSGVNNGFLMLIGSVGLLGLIAFIFFIIRVSPNTLFTTLIFTIFMCWGYVLHPVMIFLIGAAYAIKDIREKNTFVDGQYIASYSRR